MGRSVGIIAYGEELDRQKLAVLAKYSNVSASQYIIQMIRENYEKKFRDADPDVLM